jgi:hypothetical protein
VAEAEAVGRTTEGVEVAGKPLAQRLERPALLRGESREPAPVAQVRALAEDALGIPDRPRESGRPPPVLGSIWRWQRPAGADDEQSTPGVGQVGQ